MNLFRRKAPAPLQDAELGTLRFLHGSWQSARAADGIVLVVRAGRRGPDVRLRAAAVHARRNVAVLEQRARGYLATEAERGGPWAPLTLTAVDVFRPSGRWWARGHGDLACVLWFAIDGDRNVIEVVFVQDVPVAWDYH